MIQQAMAANLDTVHIRRNLTRPPGISPVPSRRPTSSLTPSLPSVQPQPTVRSRKRHEIYRPPTPPLPAPRHEYGLRHSMIQPRGVTRSATTCSDSLSFSFPPRFSMHQTTSNGSSNSTLNAGIPNQPRRAYTTPDRPHHLVHEVRLDNLSGDDRFKFSGIKVSRRTSLLPGHGDVKRGGSLRRRVGALGLVCRLRLRKLGEAVATLSVKR
ncbi:hypothetical protein CCMSSC00406_0001376 [Pleurotus cornucopiae]|uniref:Uncharacterized protein n=1 Tax=Pleurotus cornucopiae TaxID=5321 RepID=A0ACB7IM57_PLECO|nr:hypothetical protein CCMSSC00406_0001376 [Pleurotus cornucopiae]